MTIDFALLLPVQEQIILANKPKDAITQTKKELQILPVGIEVSDRDKLSGVLIKGLEDGSQPIDFTNWLVPFDVVIDALDISTTSIDADNLELRTPGLVTRINLNKLQTDPQLGLVFSIAEIKSILGVSVNFKSDRYSLNFEPPWLGKKAQSANFQATETPVILNGLNKFTAPKFGISTIAQELNLTGSSSDNGSNTNTRGQLTALGTAWGGSWLLRVNQANLGETTAWELQEAQYLKQRDSTDLAIGSQPTFWQSNNNSRFWGTTTIQRWGFSPPTSIGVGFSPPSRLQGDSIERTVTGEAEPGTLVQLTQGIGNQVIDEVLVDSSGLYQFENVSANNFGGDYQVLLFPNGQLTAQPIVESANFLQLPGQLTKGTSALIASAGSTRQNTGDNNFFGEFEQFIGGVSYRRGVSDDLTLGVGTFYDESTQLLGELFYQPANSGLRIAVAATNSLDDGELELNSNLRYEITSDLNFNFSSDRFSERFSLNQRITSGISTSVGGNSRDNAFDAGLQLSYSDRKLLALGLFSINTNNEFRWNVNSRFHRWELTSSGNSLNNNSGLSYNLSSNQASDVASNLGHSINVNYASNTNNNFTSLSWYYRSPNQLTDGRYLWDLELGYGWGSQGNGLIASTSTAIIPGLSLQFRYDQASITSGNSNYRIELTPRLNLNRGINPGELFFERLSRQGGLSITPFLDENNNGLFDRDEKTYLKNSELLLKLNNDSINSLRSNIQGNSINFRLFPDTYRVDLDPAGLPLDWQATKSAYAAEVVAGTYTQLLIPLVPSYTVTGYVRKTNGDIIPGAKIEAVSKDNKSRVTSISNLAGVFYLEGLQQKNYDLLINGKPAKSKSFELSQDSAFFQEIDLHVAPK